MIQTAGLNPSRSALPVFLNEALVVQQRGMSSMTSALKTIGFDLVVLFQEIDCLPERILQQLLDQFGAIDQRLLLEQPM